MTEDLKKAIADYFGYKSYDDMDTSDRAMAELVAAYMALQKA